MNMKTQLIRKGLCIYSIGNTHTKKIYIGSTNYLSRRISEHRVLLRTNEHWNKQMQSDWNEYGENSFIVNILERFEDESIKWEKEQYWMDNLSPEYNICKFAGKPDQNMFTKEIRKKITEGLKGRFVSDEMKKKISLSNTGKIKSENERKNISERTKGSKNPRARKVIDTSTGKIWNCAKECAIELGIKYSTLAGKLCGNSYNNTTLKYL